MNSFLITLSLLLHGVTFVIIFYLFQRIQRTKNLDDDQRVKEIEDLFNSYLLEIKDENSKFVESLSKLNSIKPDKPDEHVKYDDDTNKPDTDVIGPDIMSDQLDTPSTESQALYMYKQGLTIDHIARELDLGHTEVELIIKFNEKIHQ